MSINSVLLAAVVFGWLVSGLALAQQQSAGPTVAYPEAEASSGYFRDTEPLLPGAYQK